MEMGAGERLKIQGKVCRGREREREMLSDVGVEYMYM